MLYRNQETLSIASATTIGAYTHDGENEVLVQARVDLAGIVGGVSYTLITYVNGLVISPDSTVPVPSGRTQAIMQSRSLILNVGDEIIFQCVGDAADTAVDVSIALMDVTPVTVPILTETVVEEIGPQISAAISSSLSNISVRPERVVLSPITPCPTVVPEIVAQGVRSSPRAIRQMVVTVPPVISE